MPEQTTPRSPPSPVKALKTFLNRHCVPDSIFLRRQYRHRTGNELDLSNPRCLSEKLQWLKLHDRSQLHTLCADKIRVRGYVAAHLGEDFLVPCLGVAYDPNMITPETVRADRFVLKSNHDQGGIFISTNRASFDWEGVRAELSRRLRRNKYYDYREPQYFHIRPGVLVEEYLEAEGGAKVRELKVYCFNGAPRIVRLVLDRFENKRDAFYDTSWNRLPFGSIATPLHEPFPRPTCLDRVVEAAATLARPFVFSRTDFLMGSPERAWFGEVTFHPGAGLTRFRPDSFDRLYGDMLDLSRLPETKALQRAELAALGYRPGHVPQMPAPAWAAGPPRLAPP